MGVRGNSYYCWWGVVRRIMVDSQGERSQSPRSNRTSLLLFRTCMCLADRYGYRARLHGRDGPLSTSVNVRSENLEAPDNQRHLKAVSYSYIAQGRSRSREVRYQHLLHIRATMPDSLQIALKNDSDSSNIHAYISGIAIQQGGQRCLLKADGKGLYFPEDPPAIGTPLAEDCAISLGSPGNTTTVTVGFLQCED